MAHATPTPQSCVQCSRDVCTEPSHMVPWESHRKYRGDRGGKHCLDLRGPHRWHPKSDVLNTKDSDGRGKKASLQNRVDKGMETGKGDGYVGSHQDGPARPAPWVGPAVTWASLLQAVLTLAAFCPRPSVAVTWGGCRKR